MRSPYSAAPQGFGNVPLDSLSRRARAQAGVAALKAGHAAQARAIFEELIRSGPAEPALMIALSIACRDDGAPERAMALVDKVLAADGEQVRALLLKGEMLAAQRDPRAASAFYLNALRLVGDAPDVPAEIRVELDKARAFCDAQAKRFDAALENELARAALSDNARLARFSESVDILFGRKTIYPQAPRYYFFPGLPQKAFFERADFPFLDAIEAATPAIREELQGIMRADDAFEPYVKSDPNRPARVRDEMADNPAWGAFYLWKDGKPVEENLARCPVTARALETIPLCSIPNRSPSVLFSRLLPGARIPPHNGLVNTRLICHLPLIVPPGCRFRVGNDTREWVEGRAWVFDDSIEHEAWNDSAHQRVILLFEIWRPELSEDEKRAVLALFAAIDAEHGAPASWDI
jgi:aspartate beta-hydroxylase